MDVHIDAIGEQPLRSFDLSTLGGILRVCHVELVLLDGQPPMAAVTSFVHDQALLCTFELGARTRGRFMLPVDWCLLGWMESVDPATSWCHGVPLAPGGIVSVMPEGITEFALGAHSRVTFVLVPLRRFQQRVASRQLGGMDTGEFEVPLVSGGDLAALQAHYQGLQRRIHSGEVGADEIDRLLDVHAGELFGNGTAERRVSNRNRRARYLILRRAEDMMRANIRRHIYMQELCDAAGVSERALRYAFEELVGISPVRYLSMLRLCEACRTLSTADAGRKSVKSVALSCGLWDLSRFADNYRRVFGELPSETLMRGTFAEP
ncbi:AraC family transcriptional regulator [Stenotrophomonas mori]|uniref:Helix-turn-helix domain-containing protein n=1 Tax=Stenotrophomonas mori TaxID=2871096 RepID=A0ABT0SDZ0_9GAMM|nr:helix-turn-helix domain-containing protein [Stenotrophomonas mori]MCL7713517.1 helix-turn-helix domain-containing protein [Stenotrophomonas mori]